MRANEFINEWTSPLINPVRDMGSPVFNPPSDLECTVDDLLYKLQKGEARDLTHAIQIAAAELAAQVGIEPEDAKAQIKAELEQRKNQ